jgi:AraC family transcriptional regulator
MTGRMLVWVASGAVLVEQRGACERGIGTLLGKGRFLLLEAPALARVSWHAASAVPASTMVVHIGQPLLDRAARELYGDAPVDLKLRDVSASRDTILSSLLELLHTSAVAQTCPDVFLSGIAQAMAAHLVIGYASRATRETSVRGGLPAHKLQRSFASMRAGLAEPFDLQRLAREAGLSVFHFSRVFKQAAGMPPSRYFVQLRIDEAKRLLSETGDPIIAIGMALGYRSPSHFSCVFRQLAGVAPSAYRDQVAGAAAGPA